MNGAVSAGATNYLGTGGDRERTRVIPLRGTPQDLAVWHLAGGDGGDRRRGAADCAHLAVLGARALKGSRAPAWLERTLGVR